MAWGALPSAASPADVASELISKAKASGTIVVLPMRKFGSAELVALCEALDGNASVTELKASGKATGTDGARALGTLLASGCCGLRHLAVGDADFGVTGGLQALAQAFLDAEGGHPCPLHSLDLGFKGLGPYGHLYFVSVD